MIFCTTARPSPVPCDFVVKNGMKQIGQRVASDSRPVVGNRYALEADLAAADDLTTDNHCAGLHFGTSFGGVACQIEKCLPQ